MLNITDHFKTHQNNIIIIYSKFGLGKTTLFGMIKPKKIRYIDIDQGSTSFVRAALQNKWPKVEIDGQTFFPNVDLVTPESFEEMHSALWNIELGYDIYVIDTISRAYKRHIEPHYEQNNKQSVALNVLLSTVMRQYVNVIEDNAWKAKRHNNAWTFVLAHQKKSYKPGEKKGELVDNGIEIDLKGQASDDLGNIAECVLHMEIVRVPRRNAKGKIISAETDLQRVFRTQPIDGVPCKDRSGALDPIEPADLSVVIRKIMQKRKEIANVREPERKERRKENEPQGDEGSGTDSEGKLPDEGNEIEVRLEGEDRPGGGST